MNPVPSGATVSRKPAACARNTSNCPSQTIARPASAIARLARSNPNSTRPFLNKTVSGEFTYLGSSGPAPANTRPLKAITRPPSSRMGNINRLRNRSYTRPDCAFKANPAAIISSSVNPFFFAQSNVAVQAAGAYPRPNLVIHSCGISLSFR